MSTYFGYLHLGRSTSQSSGGSAQDVDTVLANASDFREYSPSERETYDFPQRRNWSLHRFISQNPLLNEQPDMIPGPYAYPFCVFRNPVTSNLLIAAHRYKIANAVIKAINVHLASNLIRFSIDVQAIVERLLAQDADDEDKSWFVTNLQLDINSFASKLESLSLDGTDIVGSGFLRSFGPRDFTVRQVGLRLHANASESARLGYGGAIQLYSDRLRELERCLGLVKDVDAFVTPL